jgi:signal transduction histidine kinase
VYEPAGGTEKIDVAHAAVSYQLVPMRALLLSLVAMGGAIGTSVFWPQAVVDQEVLASGLALVPAFLIAHYRGWWHVSLAMGAGLLIVCSIHLAGVYFGRSFGGSALTLFVVVPYLAIALGAGWFGEIRQYDSELRATQLQLIQSEKLESIGRMAAGVAHEVKNPLMTILTGVKVLSRRLPDADEQTRLLLQDMAEAVARADRIIGGLLSYSRERGLDLAPADLNATVEQSLLLVKHELDKTRISVVKDLDPALPPLMLDQFKIQQVLVNLFTNAQHAMGQDGRIAVRTSLETVTQGPNVGRRSTDAHAPGDRVAKLEIDDTGPGIREDHLRKVFDPFFTTKPTGVGTGLGLSVSKQIVELHGGTIAIGNRAEGGARVTMTFKLEGSGVSA